MAFSRYVVRHPSTAKTPVFTPCTPLDHRYLSGISRSVTRNTPWLIKNGKILRRWFPRGIRLIKNHAQEKGKHMTVLFTLEAKQPCGTTYRLGVRCTLHSLASVVADFCGCSKGKASGNRGLFSMARSLKSGSAK